MWRTACWIRCSFSTSANRMKPSPPGSGFGPGGEGFIRFALVENEQRIQQAVRQLRKGLTKLG